MRQCGKIVQHDRLQMTIWRMRIACWIIKATATHSEYKYVIQYLPLFHGDNGYADSPQCYVFTFL